MENKNLFGNVFNIQRYSLDDGDGIRTCVFLKGCPLNCKWCHNAESRDDNSEIAFYSEDCIMCGECLSICPCHTVQTGQHNFNREGCVKCGRCADDCPTKALEVIGTQMLVDQVVKKVLRDAPFFGKNGGVTITGGEPMRQFEFSLELAKRIKKAGYSVVIETCGYAETEKFAEILKYCDCFYYDCKADSQHHEICTGKDDKLIMQNLDYLLSNGANVVLRCPIVPNANLTDAYIEKIIRIADKYKNLAAISLLPYHKYGVAKSDTIGKEKQDAFMEPDKKMMDELKAKIGNSVKTKII